MEAVLRVFDETPGSQRRPAGQLKLASEKITVAEIIRRRVVEEVESYNHSSREVFAGLVQPQDAEALLNGYRVREQRKLDPESQVAVALKGFEDRDYILLLDDVQVDKLDQEFALTGDTTVTFLKMVPLVGG